MPKTTFATLLALAWTGVFLSGFAAAADADLDQQMSALQQARDLPAMRERMDQANEDELSSPAGWSWRIWLATADQEIEQAQVLAEEAVDQYPNNAELLLLRTSLRVSELDGAGAFASLRVARAIRRDLVQAVELEPDSVAARISLIQYYLNAPRVAGGGARRAESHLEALRELDSAAWLDMQAIQALIDEDIEASASLLEQALAKDASSARRTQYGYRMQQLERWDEAFEVFSSLVEEFPNDSASWYQLGRTAVLAKTDLERGRAAFERFLDLPAWPGEPSHAAAWWRLGDLYLLAENPDAARQAYERSLQEDETFAPAQQALDALTADDG